MYISFISRSCHMRYMYVVNSLSLSQTPLGPAIACQIMESLVTDKQVKFDWTRVV